jgi:hypothetical protein
MLFLQGHILSTARDALRSKTDSHLVYGRYEPGIEAGINYNIPPGLISDEYWYKAGMPSGHNTIVIYSLIPVLIPILYTQVAPYILVQHQYFKPTTISFEIRNVAYNGKHLVDIHKKMREQRKATPLGIQ